jgi:ArsR family metal-binding transcriptional regulator
MLIKQYRTEFFRPPNPEAQHLRCVAHLDGDISEVLPYLNVVLGGHQFFTDPLSLTLKFHGKLITLTPRQIAINILKDENEADNILNWLTREINETWERRRALQPSFEVSPKPRILEILKFLPRTNCRECGQPTCMVFATQVSEGIRGPDDCPPLDKQNKLRLQEYLGQFRFL